MTIDPEVFRAWQQRQVAHEQARKLADRIEHLAFMAKHNAEPQPRIAGFNDFSGLGA